MTRRRPARRTAASPADAVQ